MGYERNDRRYGRDQGPGRDRYGARDQYSQGASGYGDQGRRDERHLRDQDHGRQPQGYDYDDRGFFDRAGDEVRSWFGDEEAERRRRFDERYAEREQQRNDRGPGGGRSYGDPAVYGYGATAPRANFGRAGGSFGASSSGDYGAGRGAGATGSWGLGAGHSGDSWGADPSYSSWRSRQLESFDRDYADYQREHQSKFDSEFHGWRQTRQTQRDALAKVQEHQEVVGSDGQHVGKVDKVRGDRIILTKSDQDAGGHHHSIPSSWIQSVDDKVTISKTADQAHAHWRDEERNSAIGSDRNRDDANGPQNLNRSFSGTY